MPNLTTTTTTAGADISACHLCLSKSPNLEFLDSGWRLVPLCPRCLPRILSASACSYCFQPFPSTTSPPTLRCRRCSRRIHLRCAPILRGYAAPSDLLDPDRFDCTDCCPIIRPRPRPGAPEKWRAITRETAAKAKTTEAAAATGKMHGVLSDEELALRLHLEMNGSRRTRNSSKRARCNDNSVIKKVDCVNHHSRENVGFSAKGFTEKISVECVDRCSRSTLGEVVVREEQGSCCQSSAIGKGDLVEVVANGDHENCDQSSSSIKLGCFEKVEMKVNLVEVEQHNEMDGNRESSIVEVPVIEDEDHGRCDQSSSSVKLDEYDQKKVRKGSDLVEVLVTDLPKVYEESNLGELNDTLVRSESQQKRYEVRDRYMKKYRKRRRGSDLGDIHVNKGPGICDQCSSSVKLDCAEKAQNEVTKGCRNSNLVEKHLPNEVHGCMQSNLVEVSVSKNHGSPDQSLIKLRCSDNQKSVTNAYSGSNLVEVAVNEHEKILKGSSSIEVESNVTNYQEGMNGCINIGLVSVPIEEQERFSKSIDPISVSCQSIGKLNDTLVQSEFRVHNLNDAVETHPKRCDVPDRYMKKYSKRRSHMKGIMDQKESRLVPCVQTCSSEMSRSLSSMHSSPHTRLPGHR